MGCRVRWLACAVLIAFSSHVAQAQQKQQRNQQQLKQSCKDARPDSPKDLKLKAMPSTSSIGAVWKAPGNGACVDYYLVYVRPSSGSTREPKSHQVKSKSIIISNLRPNTAYQVDIIAVNKKGRSPNSRQTLTTLNGPSCNPNQSPGPVRSMKGYAATDRTDKVTLDWQAPNSPATACLTGYRLEGYDANTGVRVVVTTVATEIREISVNGLVSGTKYNFKIVSLSSLGDGKASTVGVTTTSAATPAPVTPPPAPVTPPPAQTTAPPPAAPSRQQTPPPAMQPPPVAPAPSVPAGQSNGPCQTSQQPPAPQTFVATPVATDKVTLSWSSGDPGICVDNYHIDGYELKSGDPVAQVDTPNAQYTVTKLKPGVEYVFTVSAKNKNGESVPGTAMATIPKPKN